jgi:hypothetical protein
MLIEEHRINGTMLNTNTSQITRGWNNVQSIMIIALIVVGLVAGAGAVAGQDDPPGEPVNFYGEAEFDDGQPVPDGTTIVAVVDGDVEDTINVSSAGQYGGPDAFDNKLATSTGAGEQVSFHINGPDGPAAIEGPVGLEDGGTFEQDLTFESPPNFEVNITDTPVEVTEGDDVTVEYQVENTGGQSGTQAIEFLVDGTVEGTQTVTLNGEEISSNSFTYTTVTGDAPELITEVRSENDTDTATVAVNESPPNFEVNITDTPVEVTEGDEVTVEYQVENTGEQSGTQAIEFLVDGTVEGTQTVTLDDGELRSDSFTYTTVKGDAPELTTEVRSENDTDTATVAVDESGPPEVTLSNLSIAGEGEDVTVLTEAYDVSVELSYDSGVNGTVPLELSIGDVTATTTVPLNVSETKTVTFESVTDGLSTGIYDVTVSAVNASVTGEATLSVDVNGNGEPATDTTGNGLLNDVDGDGSFGILDIQVLFSNLETDPVQNNPGLFNFNGDDNPDEVTVFDVQELFTQIN